MNDELDAVRAFARSVKADNGPAPAELRDHVLKQLPPQRKTLKTNHKRRSLMPLAGSLTAAAAATAVIITASGGFSPGTGATSRAGQSPDVVTAGGDGHREAVRILLAAATTARTRDTTAPDASAYVYTRTKEHYVGVTHGADGPYRAGDDVREAWLSVDGKHPSAVTPTGCKTLITLEGLCTGKAFHPDRLPHCDLQPAYDADAPATGQEMLTYLLGIGKIGSQPKTNYIFKQAEALLAERWVTGPVRAAVYDALATLPDIEVVKGVNSITGQSGVAVAYVDADHYRHELLMDPETYDLLGTREITLRKLDNLAAGSVMYERSIITSQVVPTLGVRPDGSSRKVIMPKPDRDLK